MKILRKMIDQMTDEVDAAEEYANCAVDKKKDYPELSKMYLEMAEQEKGHALKLHDAAVKMIEAYRKVVPDPPSETMQQKWKKEHEWYMSEMDEINTLIEEAKKS